MAYIKGTKTYTAYTDMEAQRVVVLRTASSTTPMEVELADDSTSNLLGVTLIAAEAGETVSVRPFDGNGTYELDSAGSFSKGDALYVFTDGTGRVDNTVTTAFVGYALEDGAAGQHVQVVLSSDEVSASGVNIVDAGDYYTSTNVEGALQEVGASLLTSANFSEFIQISQSITHPVGGGGSLFPNASNGGRLSTDSEGFQWERPGSSIYGYGNPILVANPEDQTDKMYFSMPFTLRYEIDVTSSENVVLEVLYTADTGVESSGIQTELTSIASDGTPTRTGYSSVSLPSRTSRGFLTTLTEPASSYAGGGESFHLFCAIDPYAATIGLTYLYGFRITYPTKQRTI